MKRNRNNGRGFTLIEVVATLAILSVAFVVLIKSQTQSLSNVQQVGYYERAVFITENQLHWTFLDLNEAENWEDFADLSGEDGDYDWRVIVEPVEMENDVDSRAVMLRIRAVTTWPQGRRHGEFHLETWYLWGDEQ